MASRPLWSLAASVAWWPQRICRRVPWLADPYMRGVNLAVAADDVVWPTEDKA
jgi:hypothetical protein